MAPVDLQLIDVTTGEELALRWLDSIVDFKFGSPFFFELHGAMQNFGNTQADVPAPTITSTPLGAATLIAQSVIPSHTASETDNWFLWVPSQSAVVGFDQAIPPNPIFGTIGWPDFATALASYGGATAFLAGLQNSSGAGHLNSFGNPSGPFMAWEATANTPTDFSWTNMTTDVTRPLSQASALADGLYLLTQAVAAEDIGGVITEFFAPGPVNADKVATAFFRQRSATFEFLYKVKNAPAAPSVKLILAGGLPVGSGIHGVMNVSAALYTTGNADGTVNITGAQAAKVKTLADLTAQGITPDVTTSVAAPPLTNGTFQFTTYRVPSKPLFLGAHIKATAPIPSV